MTDVDPIRSPISPEFGLPNMPLSLESLLVYIETQLDAFDGEIDELMKKQKLAIEQKDVLREVALSMDSSKPPKSEDALAAIMAQVERLLGRLEASDPVRREIEASIDAIADKYDEKDDFPIGKEQWKKYVTGVQHGVDNLAESSEFNMIRLQSAMSHRQTAVQLITNMINKLSETGDAIVRNI
jgi:hypothetical protein